MKSYYKEILKTADDAIKLQNKLAMEAALVRIRVLADCGVGLTLFDDMRAEQAGMTAEKFEAAELAQHETRNGGPVTLDEAADVIKSMTRDPAEVLKDGAGGTVNVKRVKLAKGKK